MNKEEAMLYAEISARLKNGQNLTYTEKETMVIQCEKMLETTGFRRLWSLLLINAFKIAYGGI